VIKAIAVACVAAAVFPLLIILLVSTGPAPVAAKAPAPAGLSGAATAVARADIPPDYLIWYMDAAQTCPGLPWSVLAGIGTVESDNGQSDLPGVHSGANFAGAEGPMQFEPATFAAYAAGPVLPLSPYEPADAIYTAAAMLCANGARSGSAAGIENAIFTYNHADWYVTEVMSWAAKYAAQSGSHGVATAIAFAKTQLGRPYQWRQPDQMRMAALACSTPPLASTSHAPLISGPQDGPIIPLSQIRPGDLPFSAGSDGTRADPGHVVMHPRRRPGHTGNPDRRRRSDRTAGSVWRHRHPARRPCNPVMTINPTPGGTPMSSPQPAPSTSQPGRTATAAQFLAEAARAAASAWSQPLDPEQHSRASASSSPPSATSASPRAHSPPTRRPAPGLALNPRLSRRT
jgi:hypothetical protein